MEPNVIEMELTLELRVIECYLKLTFDNIPFGE